MWQEMYLILFRAATRALAQMQTQNYLYHVISQTLPLPKN